MDSDRYIYKSSTAELPAFDRPAANPAPAYKWRSASKVSDAWKIFWLILFVLAVSLLFTIRLSLRLDESQSLWQTSRTVPVLLSIVARDVHVPLYHLILHFWEIFLGNGVATARLVSLFFFAATIPAVYALGKESYGRKVALFSAVLVAFSPFLNWYGVEARMYSMLVFVTVLNQYFFIRLFREDRAGLWWGYALTALAGAFTHYFFLLSLLTQGIYFLANRKLFPKRATRNFSLIAVMLASAYAPWVYFVYKLGFAATTQPHLTTPSTFNVFDTWTQFLFGFQTDHLDTALVSLWPISMLLALFALRRDRRKSNRRGVPPYTLYFLMSALLPIIIVFAISFVKPIYLSRYLILTIPSLYLFLSWLIATFPPEFAKITRVGIVLAMLLTFAQQTVSASTPVKEDYSTAVNYISQHASDQDVIVLAAPFTIYPVEYYYKGSAQIQTLPVWDQYSHGGLPAFDPGKLADQVKQVDGDHQVAYVLLSFDQGYNEQIRLYYETHFQRLDQKNFSPGLALYVYKLRY